MYNVKIHFFPTAMGSSDPMAALKSSKNVSQVGTQFMLRRGLGYCIINLETKAKYTVWILLFCFAKKAGFCPSGYYVL